eukprot:3302889-Pyramimonas_sp.AAC.1
MKRARDTASYRLRPPNDSPGLDCTLSAQNRLHQDSFYVVGVPTGVTGVAAEARVNKVVEVKAVGPK